MPFIYKSYGAASHDVRLWASRLPEFSAVAGVPRSGIPVATMFAQHRNIPLIPIESVFDGSQVQSWRPGHSRRMKPATGPILVLDDTCWAGRTIKVLRQKITNPNVKIGAVYGSEFGANLVDLCGYILPYIHHSFEWNLLHDINARNTVTDMDGVLCQDWGLPDDGAWQYRYEKFLDEAKPLICPGGPVYAVVTARLAKYESQTRAWLEKHKIPVSRLIMSPHRTSSERARNKGFGHWKAEVFKTLIRKGGRKGPSVFLESHDVQAETIAKYSEGQPVISLESGRIWNGGEHRPTFDVNPVEELATA